VLVKHLAERRNVMETISESIHADVPAGFADRMWGEFVFRSQSAGRPRSLSDTRWWVDESPVEKGTVKFARSGDRTVTVTVDLECDAGSGEDGPSARVREHLRHDLASYRRYLEERCRETDCRLEGRRAA
jgi:hypothetical protein